MLATIWRVTLHSKLMAMIFFSLISAMMVWAAPPQEELASPKSKKLIQIENKTEKPKPPPPIDQDLTQITEAPEVKHKRPNFFYTDTQEICIYGGASYIMQSTDSTAYGVWGISYTFSSQTRFHFESAFDIFANQEGHFRVMGRWSSNFAERFRPYANLGLGVRILPNDNVGVILSWGRSFIQGGGGFEWSFTQHTAIRTELSAAIDLSSNSYYSAIMGYVLSF